MISVSQTSTLLVLDEDKTRRANALPVAGSKYKRGDLLVLKEDNTVTLADDVKKWDVVCGQDFTDDTVIKEIPVYYGGCLNVEEISIKGVKLKSDQYLAVRAKATLNRIELSKVRVLEN